MRLRLAVVCLVLLASAIVAPTVGAQVPQLDPNLSVQAPKVTVTLTPPADPVNVKSPTMIPVNVSIEIPGPIAEGKVTVQLNTTQPDGWRAIAYPPVFELPFTTSHTSQILYAPVYFAVDPADDAVAMMAEKVALIVTANTSSVAKGTATGEADVTPGFGGALRMKAPVAATPLKEGAAVVPVDVDAAVNAPARLTLTTQELPKGCTLAPLAPQAIPAGGWKKQLSLSVQCPADSAGGKVKLRAVATMDGAPEGAKPLEQAFEFRVKGPTGAASSPDGQAPAPEAPPTNAVPAWGLLGLVGAAGAALALRRRT